MRTPSCSILVLLCGCLMPAMANAQEPVSADRVAWLAGCWERKTATRVVEEIWMAPRGGTMLGMGRTVIRDSLAEFESVLIRMRNGRLVYEARPSGQAPAVFPAIIVGADSVVFELPEHDFPQRVGYARRGADSLLAWIEGTSDGQARRIPFPYARAACPSR